MFQKDLLNGRGVFITGGGTGLGRSMSLRLAELGAKMFLAGRREEPLRETADSIRNAGGEAAFATCDVRDPAAVEAAITAAAKQPGTVLNIVTTYAAVENCGSGFVVPSACAKAGVLAMTRSLAVEWARH